MFRMIIILLSFGLLLPGLTRLRTAANSLIAGRSIGRIPLGATKEAIILSYPSFQVTEVEIPLEGQTNSAAIQLKRGDEILVTVEFSDAGTAWRITTEHPAFKTDHGVGVGSTFAALVRAHGQPTGVELPEGALFVDYRIAGGKVGFQLDRGFDDVAFKKVPPPGDATVVRVVIM